MTLDESESTAMYAQSIEKVPPRIMKKKKKIETVTNFLLLQI